MDSAHFEFCTPEKAQDALLFRDPIQCYVRAFIAPMKTPSIRIPRALILLVLAVGSLWAPEPSLAETGTEAAYLLRLERVRQRQGVCVLLRGDGQYHLEHHTPDKIRVFEGTIDPEETRQLVHIVSGDQLYLLQQKQIADPMLRAGTDEVILSVLRPQYAWQELMFPDPPSREPYRESLVPLLDWLERLEKRKGRELSEDEGRNNCQPLANLELKVRPAKKGEPRTNNANAPTAPIAGTTSGAAGAAPQEAATAGAAYVLRMVDSVFERGTTEMSCTLVTPSGAYHFVKQSRTPAREKCAARFLMASLTKRRLRRCGSFSMPRN